jgi:hypothetical protein
MWPFGGDKGKRRVSRTMGSRAPTGRVVTLSSQGISEPEIIQTLKNEGYSPLQVDQAMKEALRASVGTTGQSMSNQSAPYSPQAPLPTEQSPEPMMSSPSRTPVEIGEDIGLPPLPSETEMPIAPDIGNEPMMPARDLSPPLPGEDTLPRLSEPIPRLSEPMTKKESKEGRRRALEELAEAIIDEKWVKIREEIITLKSQLQEINLKTSTLEQSIKNIQGDKKTDMEQIEDKIDTYKQSIGEVSARMESIENAMKDSLTPMMQSMRSLTETIRTMKNKKE